jgi:beta-lactam-binding protein with PASTA domain
LQQAGLTVNVYPPGQPGTVFATRPVAGTQVKRGSAVNVFIA